MPLISVILPTYNAVTYLPAALDSLLRQTLGDFEVVVVDNDSQDGTWEVLQAYANRDSRFRLLRNQQRLNLAHSLNKALDAAQGRYIARMDADDLAIPERFAVQVAHLEAHPQVDVLAMNISEMDADGQPLYHGRPRYEYGASPSIMPWELVWGLALPHQTVMARWDKLKHGDYRYHDRYPLAEDYSLWTTLCRQTQLERLLQVGVCVRQRYGNMTIERQTSRLSSVLRVLRHHLDHYLQPPLSDGAERVLFQRHLQIEGYRAAWQGDFRASDTAEALDGIRRLALRFLPTLCPSDQHQLLDEAYRAILTIGWRAGYGHLALLPMLSLWRPYFFAWGLRQIVRERRKRAALKPTQQR
ncbi:MAG: glycosyltransferase [Anaerolineae bacterium]|nr:glycosyltransferase [Anaerolineae bacterium]MDW8171690.1 glycosyltransferase family A protein [Anaerolineae bacterium]